MAIILKGLSGGPTIQAHARNNSPVSRTFDAYGYVAPPVIAASYVTNRANVVDLGAYDTARIVTQPSHGRLIQRADKKFTWDMNEAPHIATARDVSFTVETTTNGVTQSVTRTYLIQPAEMGGGWGEQDYYRLETDADNRFVIEPPPDARLIHIATDGLTAAQIAALEGGGMTAGNVTASWLYNNKATGQNVYYGETPALALEQSLGDALNKHFVQSSPQFTSWVRLYKRGQTFVGVIDGNYTTHIGDSRLHPVVVGAYGTGAEPHFAGKAPKADLWGVFLLRQDYSTTSNGDVSNASWIATDGVKVTNGNGYAFTVQTQKRMSFGNTFRRIKMWDNNKVSPAAATWLIKTNDRCSGMFTSSQTGLLVEDVFVDLIGWGIGYRANGDPAYPKIPEPYSHNFYMSGSSADLTVRNIITTRACGNALQLRPGGIMENVFASSSNSGSFNAQGPRDFRPFVQDSAGGSWSLTMDYIQTQAGYNDAWIPAEYSGNTRNTILSQGYRVQAPLTSVDRMVVINRGTPGPFFQAMTDFGPGINPAWGGGNAGNGHMPFLVRAEKEHPFEFVSTVTSLARVATSGWAAFPDELWGGNIDAVVPKATRDAMTLEALTQDLTGSPGAMAELAAWLRQQETPWDVLAAMKEARLDPFFGPTSTRATGQTVIFRPQGETPGCRSDIRLDWSTGDLPGTFAGDSVDDDGHRIIWNMRLLNPLEDYFMRTGGSMIVKGDTVRLNGNIVASAAGNTAKIHHGRLYANGRSGGTLTVDIMDGRFRNDGTMDGTNVRARYKGEAVLGYNGSDFTLNSGRDLTLYGWSRSGFDGNNGGASVLTLSSGSNLRFKPTMRMTISGMHHSENIAGTQNLDMGQEDLLHPRTGSIVRGVTSGATAVCRDYMQNAQAGAILVLDDMTAPFQVGEGLIFEDCIYGNFTVLDDLSSFGITQHGFVNSMDTQMATLKEWRTGMHGFAAPNVASSVVTNGNLHLDVTNLANGTYPLITVDSRTGTLGNVTAAGNVAKAITVASTATGLTMTLADGSGQIN